MNNAEVLRSTCKLICNTCYVDDDVLRLKLEQSGLPMEEESSDQDFPTIVSAAIEIVKGWAETSRTENGISTSVNMENVNKNILYWCNKVGLDASEYVDNMVVMENGSNMW